MKYVAQRLIKVVGRDSKVTVYKPGDVIPDFDTWNIHARRSHLSLEWVTPFKGEEESFRCGPCEKTFKSARALQTHVGIAHKG